jgi:hypothetical protein
MASIVYDHFMYVYVYYFHRMKKYNERLNKISILYPLKSSPEWIPPNAIEGKGKNQSSAKANTGEKV